MRLEQSYEELIINGGVESVLGLMGRKSDFLSQVVPARSHGKVLEVCT